MLTTLFFMCCLRCVTLLLCAGTLTDAGCKESDLPLAQLLRQKGAEWPDELADTVSNRCWCAAAVAWARAEGCTAPALEVYSDESDSDIDDDDDDIDDV
jgi:hypothetical protein